MGKQRINKIESEEKTEKKSVKAGSTKTSAKQRKTKKKNIPKAKVTVNCSYNNVLISFADFSGNVFAWGSCGCVGFTGSKKGTAFAATKAAEDAYEKASRFGVKEASLTIKGIGMGRRAAVKGLRTAGLVITSMSDHTPVPFNGCRPRKKPRRR